jgi:hypothetical protein
VVGREYLGLFTRHLASISCSKSILDQLNLSATENLAVNNCIAFGEKLSSVVGSPRVRRFPWCLGFQAAMQPRLSAWAQLLDTRNINHGLLLTILLHCVDDQERQKFLDRLN